MLAQHRQVGLQDNTNGSAEFLNSELKYWLSITEPGITTLIFDDIGK